MKIQSYKDLIVWQKSMLLVTKVFELTEMLHVMAFNLKTKNYDLSTKI